MSIFSVWRDNICAITQSGWIPQLQEGAARESFHKATGARREKKEPTVKHPPLVWFRVWFLPLARAATRTKAPQTLLLFYFLYFSYSVFNRCSPKREWEGKKERSWKGLAGISSSSDAVGISSANSPWRKHGAVDAGCRSCRLPGAEENCHPRENEAKKTTQSALSEVKAFIFIWFYFFLYFPRATGPAGSVGCLTVFRQGNPTLRWNDGVHYAGYTGKSTTQSTLAVEGKGHCHFSLKRGRNRESHTGAISVWGKSLDWMRISTKTKCHETRSVRRTSAFRAGATVSWIVMAEPLIWREASQCFIKQDFYLFNHMWSKFYQGSLRVASLRYKVLQAQGLSCSVRQQLLCRRI